MAISTNGVMLTRLTGALYNQQLSASTYSEILAGNTTAASLNAWANAAVAADFGTKTDLQVATTLITNVGLASVPNLATWVAAQLTAAGTAKRGETIISLLNSYSNMDTTEAIYGASVATFNTKVDASQALSQTSGNTGGTYAAVSSLTPASAITLLSSVDLKTTGAGDDTFTASGSTLTAGDVLNGGAGTDTLSISTTAAATLGAGVTSSLIENISATATVGTLTLDAAGMTGVAKVTNAGSTSDVVVSSLPAIVDVAITAASGATTVGFATAITSGTADSVNLALNGATGGVTLAGFETLNVTTAGSASGTATAPVVITDTSLQKLTVTGTTANFLSASFDGATGSTVATVTGSAGADSLVLTAGASAKVSGDMGAGNDNLRVSTIAAGYTVAGGDGTDTITYSGTATVAATATANLSTFETVTLTAAPASFTLAGATTVNYTTVAPTASTYVGLASGGTLALPLGGTTTLTNTLWTTPTTDTMSVTVGASTTSGALTAAITTTGMESVTIANSSVGTDTTSQRTVGVTDALLKSLTVTGNQPTALTGGGAALTTVNASGVTGNVTMTGLALSTTTASTITGGDGNDTLTAATASLADSIVGGAGNDTITGAQGADTLTGGTGNDTFTIGLNSATVGVAQQSGATLTDTITDFVSGADKLNLTQATSFLGNYANLTSGLAATVGSGVGANQAFYSLADNIVYVIASTTGVLASTDTMVKLSNAPATLAAGDLNFGSVGGASISLTALSQSVTATSTTPAASTTFTDTITGTIANVQGATTLVGGTGTDSVILSDAGTFASPVVFNSIETLVLAAGTNTVTLAAGTTNSALRNITGGSGNDAITVTNIVAGGAISLGDGADSLAAMTTVIGQTTGATFDGGANAAGTVDTVTFAASTMIATSLDQFSNFESVNFGPLENSTAHVVTLPTTNALTTIAATFGTAANVLNITGTSAQIDALTSITQAGAFAGGIILNVSNAASITFASTDTTASTATASGGINIVLGNFTNTLTVDSAKMTGVNTGTVTLDTITGGTGTDTITITGTNSTTVTQVDFTTGFENYNFTGTGATSVTPVVGAMVTGTTNFNASTVVGTTTFTFDGSAGTAAKKLNVTGGALSTSSNVITGGAGADTLTGGLGADTLIGGVGADVLNLGGGATGVINETALTTGFAGPLAISTALPVAGTVMNTTSLDIVNGFTTGNTVVVTYATADTTTAVTYNIIRNGGTLGAGTTNNVALITGNYDSTANTFTVSNTGTSSMLAYDNDGILNVLNTYIGVVLVGYVDINGLDTVISGGTTGMTFTSV